MKNRTMLRTTITGAALTIMLSACASAPTHDQATSRPAPVAVAAPAGPAAAARPAPSVLPEPTGPFAVGVRTVGSVSPAATTRVWYPARRGTGTGAPPYLALESGAAYGFTANTLRRAVPRASVDAQPAPTARPRAAVVLTPGWGLPMALSTALSQDLVSHGYVVVTVDPTFGTEDPNTLPPDRARPGRRLEQVAAALDFAAGPRIAQFAGPVDADKIAIGGHSIGGAVAFQAGLTDARVHAVFDLDGWLHGPALHTPVTVPALFVDASGLESASRAVVARTTTAVTVRLAGATHLDVTDVPCLVPAHGDTAQAFALGAIGRTGTTTTNAIVIRFLDATLRDGEPTPPVDQLTIGLHGIEVAPN